MRKKGITAASKKVLSIGMSTALQERCAQMSS